MFISKLSRKIPQRNSVFCKIELVKVFDLFLNKVKIVLTGVGLEITLNVISVYTNKIRGHFLKGRIQRLNKRRVKIQNDLNIIQGLDSIRIIESQIKIDPIYNADLPEIDSSAINHFKPNSFLAF